MPNKKEFCSCTLQVMMVTIQMLRKIFPQDFFSTEKKQKIGWKWAPLHGEWVMTLWLTFRIMVRRKSLFFHQEFRFTLLPQIILIKMKVEQVWLAHPLQA